MPSKPFYIVDVFAKDKYTGNQLAIFEHCPDLSESARTYHWLAIKNVQALAPPRAFEAHAYL